MKIHLIDGTYELFRNHFGAPPKKAPDGREVGATLGLVRSLLMLLQSDGVTHVGVAFDQVIESFRNQLWHGYKTGDGIHPDLWAQFPLLEQALAAAGFTVWPMVSTSVGWLTRRHAISVTCSRPSMPPRSTNAP